MNIRQQKTIIHLYSPWATMVRRHWLLINQYKRSRFCSALSLLSTELLGKGQELKSRHAVEGFEHVSHLKSLRIVPLLQNKLLFSFFPVLFYIDLLMQASLTIFFYIFALLQAARGFLCANSAFAAHNLLFIAVIFCHVTQKIKT